MEMIDADYLVVGAGAMGMAFVDTLVSETDASVVVVDRAHQPGGHWTSAYPFVRLHQPSAFYGVNSRVLGSDTIDRVGWRVEASYDDDAGKNELCTPVPHPDSDTDWLRVTRADLRNQLRWLDDAELMAWLSSARLNLLADLLPPLPDKPRVRERVIGMFRSTLKTAGEQLEILLSEQSCTAKL